MRTQQIDNLRAVPRFFVWAVLTPVGFLVKDLLEYLISGKVGLAWQVMIPTWPWEQPLASRDRG
jgi:hypothetical protein